MNADCWVTTKISLVLLRLLSQNHGGHQQRLRQFRSGFGCACKQNRETNDFFRMQHSIRTSFWSI